jgi:Na+-transporting methylmalonyl-CoA/oxaloacetate decarboxylase gamma subunit
MKCSDCRLWKTEGCRNNPDEKDLDYAEAFACFDLKEGYVPPADVQVDDMDYEWEALEARNRAVVALIIGLILIPVAVFSVFAGWGTAYGDLDAIGVSITFMVIGGVVGFASAFLFLFTLLFLVQYVGLKRRIKNPEREEPEGSTAEPRNVGGG